MLQDRRAVEYWRYIFDQAYNNREEVDYWDYQWRFAVWERNALSVWPNTTLVPNIGFGEAATHTKGVIKSDVANLQLEEMTFPLRHPPKVVRYKEADQFLIERLLRNKEHILARRQNTKISAIIPAPALKLISSLRLKWRGI